MNDYVLTSISAVFLGTIFLATPIENFLARHSNERLKFAWLIFYRSVIGFVVWGILSLLASAGIAELFDFESSGFLWTETGATIALAWAAIVIWIATGSEEKSDTEGRYITLDSRIEACFDLLWLIAKWTFLGVITIVALIGVYLLINGASEGLSRMSTSSAIILGAIIIALTLNRNRR